MSLKAGLRRKKGKWSNREAARLRSRSLAAAAQELGDIPEPKNPERRSAALANFQTFLLSYFPHRFFLKFSKDHEDLCAEVQASIEQGESCSAAMPRASGKTTIIELAPVWGYLAGHVRFGVLVAATAGKAGDILESIKTELLRNDELAEDFPEVCIPIRQIDDEARRCKGQRYKGERTGIEWTASHIRFAEIPGRARGGIIMADGMSAAIRGLRKALRDGELLRPDCVLVDDPQTDQSAKSESMTLDRWNLLFSAIRGLQGVVSKISVFAMVTIIRKNDLADRLTDPEKVSWRIIKTKSINKFPDNMDKWREYFRVMREDKALGGSSRLNDFYLKNRKELESGAEVAWPERITKGKVSALQGFMEYFLDNPKGFMAEHQQEPEDDLVSSGVVLVDQATFAKKTNGHNRGIIPPDTVATVMYIDTHDNALFWTILAATPDMTPFVVDYSTWPEQSYFDFQLSSMPRTLKHEYPEITNKDARIYRAAYDLVEYAVNLKLERWDGRKVHLDAVMADTGYKPAVWQKVKDHFAPLTLTKGIGLRTTQKSMAEWDDKPERRVGHHWVKQYVRGREHPVVLIDVNHWKTVASESMALPIAAAGSLTLYGDKHEYHDLFASHMTAEVWSLDVGEERTVNKWEPKPNAPDNHWFDCVVGCFVGFNMIGLHPPGFVSILEEPKVIDMSSETRKRAKL